MLTGVYQRLIVGLWPFTWKRLRLGQPPRLGIIVLLALLSVALLGAIVFGIVIGIRTLLGW